MVVNVLVHRDKMLDRFEGRAMRVVRDVDVLVVV
jgi:hypothetical protein